MSILTKIFGDPNKKVLAQIQPQIAQINALEGEFSKLSDEQLKSKTQEFKDRLAKGETLDDILVEAFAVVREAAKRVLGQRHYDVQLIGAIILHRGQIAEMKTGEGKTLTSTLAIYLNALQGKGVHVVTVNDYLARRDCAWMGQIYNFLGLTIGCIQNQMVSYVYDSTALADKSDNQEEIVKSFKVDMDHLRLVASRREAYDCDITYGTNNEFGFDYLRDNMVSSFSQMAQRELFYAIVDEVDSILIDEARTPLIISAPDVESADKYYQFANIVKNLKENIDFNIDEKMHSATFSEEGQEKIAKNLGADPWVQMDYDTTFHVEAALKAMSLYKREKEYVVKDGEVIIVDEFTGRLMVGRRYSEGIHQAIEAKEGLPIQKESKTMATITFQNYFRMYKKLAGMTGTAATEAEEFSKIYNLEVVDIPTNKPMIRKNLNDLIYKNEQVKFEAVVKEVKRRNEAGQPILIGTLSIEKNEYLGKLLEKNGVPYKMLNAKQHEKEAETIAQAGKVGAVTLATNMAGRGVDIILGGNPPNSEEAMKVKELGGLHVIGTERHEARRIDNQLRGRSGRQGDAGSSQFFVSLEDELMRIFGSDRIKGLMETLKVPEDMPIENRFISKSLEQAQRKVEGNNFDIRKHLVDYDDVINKHREVIYTKRKETIEIAENFKTDVVLRQRIFEMIEAEIEQLVLFHTAKDNEREWDIKEIYEVVNTIFTIEAKDKIELQEIRKLAGTKAEDAQARTKIIDYLISLANKAYDNLEQRINNPDYMKMVEKAVLLHALDYFWIFHLEAINHLRTGIGLRGYAQLDPLVEYKREAYRLFNELLNNIQKQIVYSIFKIGLVSQSMPNLIDKAKQYSGAAKEMTKGSVYGEQGNRTQQVVKKRSEIGRNEPCPCGSGKKYKKCCGQ
ncbi:MAG: preprotein translocase subunit SecA [Candidatus Buchananbacteria bacterium RBG_13_39_9]|uniref:Protein translocase subunit SecA n=1 Tax=Candidatus Buchananbacteria bacterium RBG_13_39_9 TaxID=1797531 RepID=A0A1G1XQK4_9BACT|nr:MAG: preprotein translocase subunit SecA [Candidatus Buchananbacteria bacterium RBG_13_39_9]